MRFLLRWLIWGPVRWLLCRLPYSTALAVGDFLAGGTGLLFAPRRRILEEEYRAMFPEKSPAECSTLARRALRGSSLNELEYLLHGELGPANIDDCLPVEGRERLDAALARQHGVILVVFHFGAHMQVMPALGHRGYALNQVVNEWSPAVDRADRHALSRWLATLVHKQRMRHSGDQLPCRILPVRPGGSPRPLVECLRTNGILIIALDGRDVGQLETFPFFHHADYTFATGPVNLALRTGAALLPVFLRRAADRRTHLIIEPELVVVAAGTRDETLRRHTLSLVKILERYVADAPDHYGVELFAEWRRRHGPPPIPQPAGMEKPDAESL